MLVSATELKPTKAAAVIMAGGHGTRFWPLSRRKFPKQFLPLLSGGESLIQATARRIADLQPTPATVVVTGPELAQLAIEQVPAAQVLVEPRGCNTAPCVGFAAVHVLNQLGDVPMLCLPADHVIEGQAQINKTLSDALALAEGEDVLVTIGIKPTYPETGYGYIHRDLAHQPAQLRIDNAFKVKQFVEKPNLETAESYLESGEYYWNSGMFAFRPSVILKAIAEHVPALSEELLAIQRALKANDEPAVKAAFDRIQSVSIDFAVMEKADNVIVLSGESFKWSDLGSWSAWSTFRSEQAKSSEVNVAHGDAIFVDSHGCAGFSQRRTIAAVGVKDLVIVDTEDAVLVCNKDSAQDVKQIVDYLKAQGREEIL